MGKFVINRTKTGFTFSLRDEKDHGIAASEVYNTMASCKNGVNSVMKNAPKANLENQTEEGYKTAKNPKFEVYTAKNGESRFRLKATNGEIIAVSEGYPTVQDCLKGIESVRKNAEGAEIVEAEK